jgi:hypothetical protein
MEQNKLKTIIKQMIKEELQEMKINPDIQIVDIDFIPGQEPNVDDQDFVTDVEVTFVISNMALARLFSKQRRVLGTFLKKLENRKAISILSSGTSRRSSPVLDAIKPKVSNFVKNYGIDEFDENAKIIDIDFSENTDFWEAHIDPGNQNIRFTIELNVLGEWI